MNRKLKGIDGENQVSRYLVQRGWDILERNFRYKTKEIDIIARKEDTIVFVEVKKRNTGSFGKGMEAVGFSKQNNIIRVAMAYIQKKHLSDHVIRFDVASIDEGRIHYIEDAFHVR
jgi:putative endonuclease